MTNPPETLITLAQHLRNIGLNSSNETDLKKINGLEISIRTENGDRKAILKNSRRDFVFSADIYNNCQIIGHCTIGLEKPVIIISQTTLPSHQTPET